MGENPAAHGACICSRWGKCGKGLSGKIVDQHTTRKAVALPYPAQVNPQLPVGKLALQPLCGASKGNNQGVARCQRALQLPLHTLQHIFRRMQISSFFPHRSLERKVALMLGEQGEPGVGSTYIGCKYALHNLVSVFSKLRHVLLVIYLAHYTCGAATVNQTGKIHSAASLMHNICPYDRTNGVIAALYQHIGAQSRDEL